MTSNADDNFDNSADDTIRQCIDLAKPKSFILYAGAGSGKTRSLVSAVRHACSAHGRRLTLRGQRVGVITYTNAACDEIQQRLEFDPRVEVSTIHSFCWSLISGFNHDIRKWIEVALYRDIARLTDEQSRGKPTSKSSMDRARAIEGKRQRLHSLSEIRQFIYSPTGANRTRDSLNHSEVISMTASFLETKPGLARLLVSRFPVLLIDESQDTNKWVMDALLSVQAKHEAAFCLGLFGDSMQRIYADGKSTLSESIPPNWARPEKRMNHRCPQRVIRLINSVAAPEGVFQRGRTDKPEGFVRLFVVPETSPSKSRVESLVSARMADVCRDPEWNEGSSSVKTLTLEHHMAARRLGFDQFFGILYGVDRFRTGVLDGTLPGLTFFTRDVLPLVQKMRCSDEFQVANIVRARSPLLDPVRLRSNGANQVALLKRAKVACMSLQKLFEGKEPTLLEVLRNVAESELFAVPDSLAPFSFGVDNDGGEVSVLDEHLGDEIVAWRAALATSFSEIEKYSDYIRGLTPFDTHQGVKGLEFPRVMVIISDEEARGFSFSYERLFGVKEKSKKDLDNENSGSETTFDRTRRLFYVTCSRAVQSLAIVYYSKLPSRAAEAAVARGWFEQSEVELVS